MASSSTLPLLSKHYAALSPTTPSLIPASSFPSPTTLCLPSTQDWLVQHLLSDSEQEVQGGGAWKKVFWRRVVKGIEEGFETRRNDGDQGVEDEEVHHLILEELVRHLSSRHDGGAPGASLRTYEWGPLLERGRWKSVKTMEEGRMISGGTTGLRTWQACISLSNHLIANPSLLASCASPIVELGAGVGLLSLVAARLNSKTHIVATDADESVLEQLVGNVTLNGLGTQVRARKLDWELASSLPDTKHELERWEAEAFDGARAQIILGADIVYDPALAAHLAATLVFLLRPVPRSSKAPQALIAGTIRNESTWSLFLSECSSRGLLIESVDLVEPEAQSGIVGAEGWEGDGEVRLVRIVSAVGE